MFFLNAALRAELSSPHLMANQPIRARSPGLSVTHLPRLFATLPTVTKVDRIVFNDRRFYSDKPPAFSITENTNQDNRGSWFNRAINNRGIIITGGGAVLALVATAFAAYLYCENNPEKEICDSLRKSISGKKK